VGPIRQCRADAVGPRRGGRTSALDLRCVSEDATRRFVTRAVGRQHRPESYTGRKLRWQEAVFAECWRLYVHMPWLARTRSPLPCPRPFAAARRLVRSGEAVARQGTGRLRFPPGSRGAPVPGRVRGLSCLRGLRGHRRDRRRADRRQAARSRRGLKAIAPRRDRPICGRPGPPRLPLGNEGGRCVP
jgi:hypothetical protein